MDPPSKKKLNGPVKKKLNGRKNNIEI